MEQAIAESRAGGPVEARRGCDLAQSNSALYAQLLRAGFDRDDLAQVRAAYRAAAIIFSGRYRVNERAFICHVVGAGSAAANFTRRADLIVAAMLHSAYRYGVFPDGREGGATPAHRAWLRERIGAPAEALVAAIDGFGFEARLPALAEGADAADSNLVFLSLTHELDELAEGGMILAPKHVRDIGRRIEDLSAAARKAGIAGLAEAFEAAAVDQSRLAELGMEALASPGKRGHLQMPPASICLRRLAPWLKSRLKAKLRAFRPRRAGRGAP